MKSFRVYLSGPAGFHIHGETLQVACETNLHTLARVHDLGTAAGYQLVSAFLRYTVGILGGKGGAALTIRYRGLPLAHEKPDARPHIHSADVWIYAEPADVPEPVEILTAAREEIRP